ncbi:uncharacterized protein LY89DRAFT_157850 [Mollisia scopiformis]|uniref:Zn(2)-C6 fungal-type domain-containing protein n=1 Tax=Mollisia scopiformis TaxID=149040 RepID=A0A194X0B3_MOLSC|nr:uncharacterized protein LY89DRAFT_157850 [Mollisia scopiformis]KUJ13394.1 hypothetical protein LY89DRAFT_157850 [Mollisia scopiformis]
MPKETHRGRPISCKFCRSRKLRCSREAPCSNCVSRGIHCDLQDHVRPLPTTSRASESELLERIRNLESLVRVQRSQENGSIELHSESPETQIQQSIRSSSVPQIEHLDNDVAWLASIYSGQNLPDKTQSNKIVFRICPIRQFMEACPYIIQSAYLSSARFEPLRCVWLPQYSEAKILIDKFVRDIDHVHHVVHTPWLPDILDEVYQCLNQQGQVKPGSILLLLGIFASATHVWVNNDCEHGLFSTCTEANVQSPLWVKAVEDVLDISHRTTSISVEGIQGISLATFVLLNMEGYSRRCRSLFNMAFLLARELRMHVIDHPASDKPLNTVRAEVERRVWWYLVASEWSVPLKFQSISQGIYYCHLRHMLVKRPLHINDEDLVEGGNWVEKPLCHPTTASYPVLRIRLSEIARHMVDRNPVFLGNAGGPSHEMVMDIDSEMQQLWNDVPLFFSMSKADLMSNYQLDSSHAAFIVHQGYMFRSLFHAQRCIIHFPYFTRGFVEPEYTCSRELCIMSARQVIQTEASLSKLGLTATCYKFLALLVATFMASIIVLMDLCHNKSPSGQEQQKKEIADAIRILEGARNESETAAKFLESLMQVMRKHKVLPSKDSGPQQARLGTDNEELLETSLGDNGHLATPMSLTAAPPAVPGPSAQSSNIWWPNESTNINMTDEAFGNGDYLSSYYNELAQSFEQGVDVGSFDWNDIFSELDSSIL